MQQDSSEKFRQKKGSLSSCSRKIAKGKSSAHSCWQELEHISQCKFGQPIAPQEIINCYQHNRSFIYQIKDQDGR